MTRVSLTEDYDDRSVISKLNEMDKRVKENASVVTSAEESARQSAQSAQETADRFAGSVGAVVQNANQQINSSKAQVDSAKAEVDETVTTVAQAVQTANQASASAQQSATTVATYGTRLTAVEDKAQGNSADIDHLEIETRDLYDRDADNVKLHFDHEQTMTGSLVVEDGIRAYQYGWHAAFKSGMAQGHYALFAKIKGGNIGQYHYIELVENSNNASAHAMLVIHDTASLDECCFSQMSSHGGNNPLTTGSIVVASDGSDIFLFWKKQAPYGSLGARSYLITNYGAVQELDHDLTWYDNNCIEYENLDAFQTVVTPVLTVPDLPADAPSDAVVNKDWVQKTGKYHDDAQNKDVYWNNLVHKEGDEPVGGQKRFAYSVYDNVSIPTNTDAKWRCVAKMPMASVSTEMVFFVSRWSSNDWMMVSYMCRNHSTLVLAKVASAFDTWSDRMAVVSDGTNEYLWVAITSNWGMFPLGGNRNIPFEPVPAELVNVRYDTFEALQSAYTYSGMIV